MEKKTHENHMLKYRFQLISSILIFVLMFIYADVNAYNKFVSRNKYRQHLTFGIKPAIYQLKMLNFENDIDQKFLESAMILTIGHYYSNGFKLEATYIHGFNNIGPYFNNSESATEYIRIYKTRMYLVSASYDYYITEKSFVSPKVGFGRMTYNEKYNGTANEAFEQKNISELLRIGVDYHYNLHKSLSANVGTDFYFGKNHVKFPMLSAGLTYFIPIATIKRISRNCPKVF